MKSQAEEFFYLATIIFSLLFLIIFLSYQNISKGTEVKTAVRERTINEELSMLAFILFNNKLPTIEKSYLEIGIDAILDGGNMHEVIYGMGIGMINANEIITPLFDKYAKGRLELAIITPKGKYTYGKIGEKEKIYTYESIIPVPEEETGKIIIRMG